jgi:hypothetical protein
MTHSHATTQAQRGRIGGLTTAANARTPQAITQAARDARWKKYLDQVPEWVTDEADRIRRAELLRRADMQRLALKATKARKLKAELRALEAELDASDLEDAGSDGAGLDS